MEYLPFHVTEYNELDNCKEIVLNSDEGRIYVRIGKLDISIKQTDDGLGVVIDCTDAKMCEQDLGTMVIAFDDIDGDDEEEQEDPDTISVEEIDLVAENQKLVDFIEQLEASVSDTRTSVKIEAFMRENKYWPPKD